MIDRVLPVGTILYRARNAADPSYCLDPNECQDTGKIGLYFSDDRLLCVGMAIEYQVDIHLCVFVVTSPIVLYKGKYCFRDINPERYFKDGAFQFDVDVIEEENISHYDQDALPIYDKVEEVHADQNEDLFEEIFISSSELDCLALLEVEELALEECKKLVD